jgi:ureidoacrylate peracid hydrolase
MAGARSIKLFCRYYRLFPSDQPLGYAEEDLKLGVDDTAFLLVDINGLGLDEDHNFGDVPEVLKRRVEAKREIVWDQIKPAKVAAKKFGFPIIYVRNYLAPSTTENNELLKMAARCGGEDVYKSWRNPDRFRYSEVIAPEESDYQLKKQHFSAFFETHLESLLKELGTRNLVAVGFDSRICLAMTLVDALYRNYRVIMLRDCVKTQEYVETKEEGWANWFAVRFIEAHVGYTATSQDFIRACAGSGA